MYKYIDVSFYQGTVDWQKVKEFGIQGVMIRAGFGKGNIDKQALRNLAECNRIGLPCGVYWFSYATTILDAQNEAKHCLSVVNNYRLDLPIAFDYEYDSVKTFKNAVGRNPTKSEASAFVRTFLSEIEKAGYYGMMYANPDYLYRYFAEDLPRKYDLWLAHYSVPEPGTDCGIWQRGTDAVDGILTLCDVDVAYKDYPRIIANAGLNHLREKQKSPLTTEQKVDVLWQWATDYGMDEKRYSGLLSDD